nr:MAG TPA_asm: hypothetical protein [Caudoviricetes sp.]
MGGNSHHFAKCINEMTLIVKSQHESCIKRMHISAKQVAGMVQTKLHVILQRRHTCVPGEGANEMIFTHTCQLSEHLQLRSYAKMLPQVANNKVDFLLVPLLKKSWRLKQFTTK